jgi:DNA-directed RNA polymerase subunit alpha
VNHEFQSIDGVVEDVTDIVLNLKKVLLVSTKREAISLLIKVNKAGAVTAGDIQADANVTVINPDQVICTLDHKKSFEAEIEIKTGRGYYPGEANKKEEQAIGVIPIDSLFSPSSWSSTRSRPPASARSRTTTSSSSRFGPTAASRRTTPSSSPPRS